MLSAATTHRIWNVVLQTWLCVTFARAPLNINETNTSARILRTHPICLERGSFISSKLWSSFEKVQKTTCKWTIMVIETHFNEYVFVQAIVKHLHK